tara:strand:+ start:2878 stop:4215 length:1338 start_codon:yes stop_codon:yes gene_type:complete
MNKFKKKKVNFLKDKKFIEKLKFLKLSSSWSKSKIKLFQEKEIKKLLKWSFKNIPYYKKKFNNLNLNFNNFDVKSFSKLPLLDKQTLKKYNNLFKFKLSNTKLYYMTTGGTTGKPLKVWMDDEYKMFSLACTYFYLDLFKLNPYKDKNVRIHGDTINIKKIKKNIFWEYEQQNKKKLIMSSYHITSANIMNYIKKISEHNPKYLHCYPSVIYLMAKIIKDMNIKINFFPDVIFTDSEMLYNNQKKLISKIFKCPVFSIYGHTEGCIFGYPDKKNNFFKLHPAVGYVELIDKNGKIIHKDGVKGEIVVTGFLNKVFPLIRYRTQDFGIIDNKKSNFVILKKIFGRRQDFIISKNNEEIPVGPALFDYNYDWSRIEKFQIHQKIKGRITFNIVINKEFSKQIKSISNSLKSRFERLLNNQFKINVRVHKEIKFTQRGKFRYLIQDLI